jgi:GNAT superfamily N-acetyltransferase
MVAKLRDGDKRIYAVASASPSLSSEMPKSKSPPTSAAMDYQFRLAQPADAPALRDLIAGSIRSLGAADYSSKQIEAALLGAFGLDTALVADGTYYVAQLGHREIVGCGGWSRRRTLFGGDTHGERSETMLDPRHDSAKIRAFFVDPAHVRRGLGRAFLERSEAAAAAAGFRRLELMATLPGVRLYAACGYTPSAPILYRLPGDVDIEFVPMHKAL